jgi:hypothetical protein
MIRDEQPGLARVGLILALAAGSRSTSAPGMARLCRPVMSLLILQPLPTCRHPARVKHRRHYAFPASRRSGQRAAAPSRAGARRPALAAITLQRVMTPPARRFDDGLVSEHYDVIIVAAALAGARSLTRWHCTSSTPASYSASERWTRP